MMRIAFFMIALNMGGAERQMTQLAKGLASKGHKLFFVTVFPGGMYWDWIKEHHEVTVKSLFEKKQRSTFLVVVQLLRSIFRLRSYIKRNEVDVIYSALYHGNVLSFPAVIGLKAKLLWSIHSAGLWPFWKTRFAAFLSRIISNFIPLIIFNSNAGLKFHQKIGIQGRKNVVIHNGINTDFFKPDAEKRKRMRRDLKIAKNQKLIGIVGRVNPIKDHRTFLKAASEILKTRDNVRFICVGSGLADYRNEMIDYCNEIQLGDHVIWMESQTDIRSVYNALDILCSTSLAEGLSNVICEAMACGVPCVVTDVGDSAYAVDDKEAVVSVGDVQGLKHAIEIKMNKHNENGMFSKQVRRRIVDNLSNEKWVLRTESVLKEFLVS